MSELFESAADFLDAELEINYLVEDVIERDTVGILFGESGAGKSFIAVDLGISVSLNIEIFNNKLAEKGLVMYIAGEGYCGLKRRVRASQIDKRLSKDKYALFCLSKTAITFDGGGIDKIIEEGNRLQIKHQTSIALIIVDTLARHMEGDENSTRDMSGFIREIGKLQAAFSGSVVLIVHHTGHNNGDRARGSSSLKAAMDFEILVERARGGCPGRISFTKMKDSELPEPIGFNLVSVDIGQDSRKKPVTSCVVKYEELIENKNLSKQLSDLENIATEVIINVCIGCKTTQDGNYYCDIMNVRSEYYEMRQKLSNGNLKPGNLKVSFQRVIGNRQHPGLIGKGVISVIQGKVFPLQKIHQDQIADAISRNEQTEHET